MACRFGILLSGGCNTIASFVIGLAVLGLTVVLFTPAVSGRFFGLARPVWSLRVRSAIDTHGFWRTVRHIVNQKTVSRWPRLPFTYRNWLLSSLFALLVFSVSHLLTLPFSLRGQSALSFAQLEGALASLTFIVIVFVIQYVGEQPHSPKVTENFVSKTRMLPVLYFMLTSIGISVFVFLESGAEGTISSGRASGVVVILSLFIVSVGYVYHRVSKVVFEGQVDDRLHDLAKQKSENHVEYEAQRVRANLKLDSIPNVWSRTPARAEMLKANSGILDPEGSPDSISDVDLRALKKAAQTATEDLDESIEDPKIVVRLEDDVSEQNPEIYYETFAAKQSGAEDIDELLDKKRSELTNALVLSDTPQWETERSILTEKLKEYRRLAEYSIDQQDKTAFFDQLKGHRKLAESTAEQCNELSPHDQSLEGRTVVDALYDEFERFHETAVRTDKETMEGVLDQTNAVVLKAIRQNHHYGFRKFLMLYASYHLQVSAVREPTDDFVHSVLDELETLSTTVVQKRISSTTAAGFDDEYVEHLFHAFGHHCRAALEDGTATDFTYVWNLLDGMKNEACQSMQSDTASEIEYSSPHVDDSPDEFSIEKAVKTVEETGNVAVTVGVLTKDAQFLAGAWALHLDRVNGSSIFEEVFPKLVTEQFRRSFNFGALFDRFVDSPERSNGVQSVFDWWNQSAPDRRNRPRSHDSDRSFDESVRELYCLVCANRLAEQLRAGQSTERMYERTVSSHAARRNAKRLHETLKSILNSDVVENMDVPVEGASEDAGDAGQPQSDAVSKEGLLTAFERFHTSAESYDTEQRIHQQTADEFEKLQGAELNTGARNGDEEDG